VGKDVLMGAAGGLLQWVLLAGVYAALGPWRLAALTALCCWGLHRIWPETGLSWGSWAGSVTTFLGTVAAVVWLPLSHSWAVGVILQVLYALVFEAEPKARPP